jgi:fermentation-respiration switch protein FrsA (DUF1100 family)
VPRLLRPVLLVVLIVVLLLGLLWLVQRRLIYLPDRSAVPPASTFFAGGLDVTLETSDRLRLGAWWVPATASGRGVAVLVAPGNAGNRTGRVPLARALAARGLDVLLFDYRGYAGNAGHPSEGGLALDVRAAYRYVAEHARVPGRIVYFGESLGAAVVTELATEHPPAALVLRSPFVDLASAGAVHYPFLPVRLLLRDRFPLADQLAKVRVPTAVVYGTADSVVPPEQSREVANRAGGPVTVTAVEGADHNDAALLEGPELIAAVVAFA